MPIDVDPQKKAEGTPSIHSILLSPLLLELEPLNTARVFGKRCKLPQRGLGWSPSRQTKWCVLALKSDIVNNFNNFRKNQLTISTKMSTPEKVGGQNTGTVFLHFKK